MKQKFIYYFLSLVIFSLSSSAFAQHINVLGIPIDGNITSFQKKLNAKGFKFNKDELENFADGIRYYNGSVQRRRTDLKVFFNRKTQLVYKVDVITHSNDENYIKRLFNKTIQSIESKYSFKKSIIDDKSVKIKYSIYSSKTSDECLGYIIVNHCETFDMTNRLKPSGFSLICTYEDAKNTSLLTPSTTEPKTPFYLPIVFENPDNFYKDIISAVGFMENECYESSINNFLSALDFFKYGCAPEDNVNYEDIIENNILEMENLEIGIIKTAYSNEYAKVYRITDENGNFKCIQYGVCSGFGAMTYNIKLNADDIKQQIIALEKMKIVFSQKLKAVENVALHEYWREKIDITMPALYGRIRTYTPLEMYWKRCNLTSEFEHFKPNLYNLYIQIYNGSEAVLRFNNIEEIDTYINFLKSVNTN